MKRTRNKLRVAIHFVWTTVDRLPLLTPEIEERVYRYIVRVCEDDGCEILAVGGVSDHIHLLVKLPPTLPYFKLMKDVKGGSSRFIAETLRPASWVGWQAHYGAFAVSPHKIPKVARYINSQKQHHTEGNLWSNAEEAFEEYEDEDHETTELDPR